MRDGARKDGWWGVSVRESETVLRAGRPVSRKQRFVRAAILAAVAEAMTLLSVDYRPLLSAAGLDADLLNQPEARIPAASLVRLLHLAAQATQRPDFALLAAQAFEPLAADQGLMWAQPQTTLRLALDVYQDRMRAQDNTLAIRIERVKDTVIFRPQILDPSLSCDPLCVDLALGVSLGSLRALLGEGWWPDLVCFAYPRPSDATAHQRLFGQVEFGCDFSGFVISARQLNQPVPPPDPALRSLVRRYAWANARRREANATGEICELIARLLPTGQCSLDHAAMRLGVDRRTIHRHLAAEGCSFTELVERIRRELIAEQIGDSRRSLTAIADLLGFARLSTFSRWHRQTFGTAARNLRRAQA